MPGQLVPIDVAAYIVGRPEATVRRWAAEGRLTRYEDLKRRKNGVLYDFDELPIAERDKNTCALVTPADAPPVIKRATLLAA
jgi:hypothetical protein